MRMHCGVKEFFIQEFFISVFMSWMHIWRQYLEAYLEASLDESGFCMIYFASSRRWAGGFLPTEGSSLMGANYHTRLPT